KRSTFFQFAAPSIFLMTLLMVIPLVMAIWLGMNFITFRNINEPEFIGLQNYIDVLGDARFWSAARFTTIYTAIVVPGRIVLGLAVALMLDQVSKAMRGVYLSFFLLPFIIVPVVGTLMFKQLFDASGLVTWAYQTIFETRLRYNETTVKTLIMIHGIWYVTPFVLVTYFAGLQTLPSDLMEAASIDGANWWQKVRGIVLPHLRSLTIFILLVSIMDSYRIFDSIFVLTNNLNPTFKADTLMTYNFSTAIQFARLGKGNAMAIITVIGIMIVLIPNLIQSYREQIEER
ncbi:MAG: carbohydrate ABC transporter permease, partial [Anaerolineae bacterium]